MATRAELQQRLDALVARLSVMRPHPDPLVWSDGLDALSAVVEPIDEAWFEDRVTDGMQAFGIGDGSAMALRFLNSRGFDDFGETHELEPPFPWFGTAGVSAAPDVAANFDIEAAQDELLRGGGHGPCSWGYWPEENKLWMSIATPGASELDMRQYLPALSQHLRALGLTSPVVANVGQ